MENIDIHLFAHLNMGKEEGCHGPSITCHPWGPGQVDDELGSHWPRYAQEFTATAHSAHQELHSSHAPSQATGTHHLRYNSHTNTP